MAVSSRASFFLFLLCLPFASLTAAELLCHNFLTSVVRGTLNRGILITKEFNFTENYYERFNSTHFRVCICTKVACLRKCCPLGQIYMNTTCRAFALDIDPPVYTENLQLIPDYGISNFHRVYGKTCKGVFPLQPEVYETDEYFLLANGTLLLPYEHLAYDASAFCFENALKVGWESSSNATLRVLVCFPDNPAPPEEMIVYPIGMIISMPFLLATFIVYSLPELRNLHGKNLMSHVASLLAAYLFLVIPQLSGDISDSVCIMCGFLIQYFFLATFFWLNVMCFDIWSTFSGFGKFSGHLKEKENKKFALYSLYAWGCPTLILIVTVVMDYAPDIPDFITKPNIGAHMCYFATKMATLFYFYCPMAIIFLSDITLFALTAIKIFKVRRETKVLTGRESRRNNEASKQRYNLYLKLFMVMGINWVTEIISWGLQGPKGLWYVTDAMNSLQGLFIFWIFVCSRKIKKILISRFCPQLASRDMETNTSSLKMSMSGNSSYPVTSGDSIHLNNVGDRKTGRAI